MTDSKHQRIIDRLEAQIARLETENQALKKENKRLGGSGNPGDGQKRCSECQVSYPDSLAFFGDGDGNLVDRCASCARATLHDSGTPHYPNGCPRCINRFPAAGGQ
jgi:hypothetical protein